MKTQLQPIDTAPRDGRYILLAGPSGYGSTPLRFDVCRYLGDYYDPWRNYANDGWRDGGPNPSHWMPVPALDKPAHKPTRPVEFANTELGDEG